MRMASFGQLSKVLTLGALGTVLAGLLLYYPTSGGLNGAWLSSAHGITLTLGALVGIAAFLHGIFVSGRTAAKMKVVADQILATQGPPAPASPWPGFLERFAPAYEAELDAFVRVVRGELPNPCDGREAWFALLVAEACEVSRRERRPVTIAEIADGAAQPSA